MITIGIPRIIEKNEYAILINTIKIDNNEQTVWFKVKSKFKEYLCYERDDAYLIAVLNYAMIHGHDIKCDAPITEDLLFKIEEYLIPALIENNQHFHKSKIISEVSEQPLHNAGAVGTGISCGVDSLHVLATKTNLKYSSLNVTHLAFNNVGSHGEGEKARQLYRARINHPKYFSEKYNFEFIESDSNLMDVITQNHFKTHTYSSMFPIFCLQKLYSTYYYASGGYLFSEFKLKDGPQHSCGAYELLSLPSFSTKTLTLYSEGLGLTRLKKLKELTNFEPAQKFLNVCLKEGDNCNTCEKCVRTLLGLDALGALDKFRDVFDIDYYRSHRKWYLQQMANQLANGKHDYFEMYPYFKKDISLIMKIKASPFKIKRYVIKNLWNYPKLYNYAKQIRMRILNN